jgi:hypothetical protein
VHEPIPEGRIAVLQRGLQSMLGHVCLELAAPISLGEMGSRIELTGHAL